MLLQICIVTQTDELNFVQLPGSLQRSALGVKRRKEQVQTDYIFF